MSENATLQQILDLLKAASSVSQDEPADEADPAEETQTGTDSELRTVAQDLGQPVEDAAKKEEAAPVADLSAELAAANLRADRASARADLLAARVPPAMVDDLLDAIVAVQGDDRDARVAKFAKMFRTTNVIGVPPKGNLDPKVELKKKLAAIFNN
jgi:hypothetical protein